MPITSYADQERVTDEVAGVPGLRYMARQPILDLRGRVYAYELLFRGAPNDVYCGDGDQATRTMVDSTLLYGLGKLTNGLPAFLNCTPEALTESFVGVLPPALTVLEVLETVEPTPAVIAACQRLKALGFRIALDDFRWTDALEPLVRLADFIKVDFLQSDQRERRMLADRLRHSPAIMLAEKIETPEEYARARAEGFTLFQGYHFCRPQLMENRDLPPSKLTQISLLRQLHEEPFDQRAIVDVVERDAALTYRLLRLANSPVFAMRQSVRTVRAALIAVGEDTFRRMAMLTIAGTISTGRPPEILRMALARARFCELAARLSARNPNEQYLVGLLSLLPAMLQVPMEEATATLPLAPGLRDALLGLPNQDRCFLTWIESAETGDWSRCDSMSGAGRLSGADGLTPARLQQCATEAMEWADNVLRSEN